MVNLGPAQTFAMRGISGRYETRPAFFNCQGAVFVEEGSFDGISLDGCDDFIARGLRLHSGYGGGCGASLSSSSGSLFLYDSWLWGKAGQEDLGVPWCQSSPGITLKSSARLYLHGSTVRGGSGGFGLVTEFCPQPGLVGWGPVAVELRDSTIDAGYNTLFATCPSAPAIAGVVPHTRPGSARHIVCESPLFEAQATTVEYHGEPGDMVFLASSETFGSSTYYPALGVHHAPLPRTTVRPIGTIPASGVLLQNIVVPNYPGPRKVRSLYLQGFFMSPGGERQLGAPTQVHVLDPNY